MKTKFYHAENLLSDFTCNINFENFLATLGMIFVYTYAHKDKLIKSISHTALYAIETRVERPA